MQSIPDKGDSIKMSEENGKLTYGIYLQSIRLKKGLSIEEVSALTRIRPEILRRIEEEKESALPGPVFVKGFIKSIAEALGAEPNEVLERYLPSGSTRAFGGYPPPVNPPAKPVSIGKLLLALVVIVTLVALATAMEHWWSAPDTSTASPSSPAPSGTVTPSSKAKPPESTASDLPAVPAPDPESPAAAAETKGLVLRVSADENTWLKVIRDEEKASEYFLKPGDQLELEARSVYSLLIGNAGGLHLELNGEPVELPDKSGQVVTLQLP